MNRNQANEMKAAFESIGGFSRVLVEHHGFAMGNSADNDGQWRVELWHVNERSGNRNLTCVREYTVNKKQIALIAKDAMGKATARDKAALARIAADAARQASDE